MISMCNHKRKKMEMTRIFALTICLASLVAAAQELPVPAPVAVGNAIDNLALLESGARWRTFLSRDPKNKGVLVLRADTVAELEDELANKAIVSEYGVDVNQVRFNSSNVAKHKFHGIVWDGVLDVKKEGHYVVMMEKCFLGNLYINGVEVKNLRQGAQSVGLKRGNNDFLLYCMASTARDMQITYRLASSTKPPRQITPAMLKHRAGDEDQEEEEW